MKRIDEVAERHGILGAGYKVDIVMLPNAFPYQKAPWEFDDRTIEIPKEAGSLWLHAYVEDRASFVAYAIFAGDGRVVRCSDVHVDEAHRRKGIATELYRLAACFFEAPVVPSSTLLEDGALFWGDRKQIDC